MFEVKSCEIVKQIVVDDRDDRSFSAFRLQADLASREVDRPPLQESELVLPKCEARHQRDRDPISEFGLRFDDPLNPFGAVRAALDTALARAVDATHGVGGHSLKANGPVEERCQNSERLPVAWLRVLDDPGDNLALGRLLLARRTGSVPRPLMSRRARGRHDFLPASRVLRSALGSIGHPFRSRTPLLCWILCSATAQRQPMVGCSVTGSVDFISGVSTRGRLHARLSRAAARRRGGSTVGP